MRSQMYAYNITYISIIFILLNIILPWIIVILYPTKQRKTKICGYLAAITINGEGKICKRDW